MGAPGPSDRGLAQFKLDTIILEIRRRISTRSSVSYTGRSTVIEASLCRPSPAAVNTLLRRAPGEGVAMRLSLSPPTMASMKPRGDLTGEI